MAALKPVCVKCQRFYRMVKSGFYFIEGMPKETPAHAGNVEPEKWKPYKLWVGDKWECLGCGGVLLSGFGSRPIAEHYQNNFDDLVKKFGATFQVNDC